MIIHGEICGEKENRFIQPLVYALLPNKEGKTYYKFLRVLKNIICNKELNPQSWVIDLEQGFITALKRVFGEDLQLIACYFHFWLDSFMCFTHTVNLQD